MFTAYYSNNYRFDSNKEGEYIVKITHHGDGTCYLCNCEAPYGSLGASFSAIYGCALRQQVKVFKTPADALAECLKAFKFIENSGVASYRVSIIKRPKQLFVLRASRGIGWEYFCKLNGHSANVTPSLENARFFSSLPAAGRKAQQLKKYHGVLIQPFTVMAVTADMLH